MAINLRQYSTSPNIGNSNLVHAVTSNSSSQAQFKFVADINDSNGDLLQRIKQQPNPNTTGVFDFGNIIPTYLGPTDEVWKIANVTANTACGKDFKIRFGEEYASTVTGFTSLYTGDTPDAAGNPNVSGSDYIFLLDGVTNPNDLINWNWNSGSKYNEEDPLDDVTFSHQNGLTLFNTSSVRIGDYHTISFLNGNLGGEGTLDVNLAQDVFAVIYRQYDADGTLLDTDTLFNTAAGPRTAQTQFWNDVYTTQDENTRLTHWPAGPQNIEDAGVPILSDDTGYYTMTFYAQATDTFSNLDGIWGEYRFDIDNKNCGYDGVRFAWKNEYGVWDYFNMGLAKSATSNIEREQYQQTFVNYSATNTSPYSKQRRGDSQYQNRVNKTHTANSDYLSQTDADNLRELFYSTNVYVQDGTEFLPVVISNASVTEKTNPRNQKLFTYTVDFSYVNNERPRV